VALKSRDGKSKIIDFDKIFMLAKAFVSTVSFEYVLSNFPVFCLNFSFFRFVFPAVSQRYANSILFSSISAF
jgi:hypothetical protein